MVVEAAAVGGAVTVGASEVDTVVGAIRARRLLQRFKTRTSSQLLVGSETSPASYRVTDAVNLKFCCYPIFLCDLCSNK